MILPRRAIDLTATYEIHVIGGGLNGTRHTIHDNGGAGYSYHEVCDTLQVQLSFVTDGYECRRIARRGLEFWVIDSETPEHSARYWVEKRISYDDRH
jgi:hypothetical protein